jgi:hypothetical protein
MGSQKTKKAENGKIAAFSLHCFMISLSYRRRVMLPSGRGDSSSGGSSLQTSA